MLVKMKFSVKIEDVEREVNSRLFKIENNLLEIKNMTTKAKDYGIVEQAEEIKKIRENLGVLDSQLEDCYDVLTSLLSLKSQKLAPPESLEKGREDDSRKSK